MSSPEADADDVVRPFILTGGRTRPINERLLRVESLVTTSPGALSAPLGFERRHIVVICQRPLSVAEIANSLKLPIGVARVLIGDLAAEGFVTVHDDPLGARGIPSREILERIRDGVRAL